MDFSAHKTQSLPPFLEVFKPSFRQHKTLRMFALSHFWIQNQSAKYGKYLKQCEGTMVEIKFVFNHPLTIIQSYWTIS